MDKLKSFVGALRPGTLPLSLSGVFLGISLAAADYHISLPAAVLTALTAVCLQILANVADGLGDMLDAASAERLAVPEKSSGVRGMKMATAILTVLCAVSGLAMIKCSFGTLLSLDAVCLMMLGAVCIGAALKYNLGRSPYGRRGLGDLYAFVFFGLVAVEGGYFVSSHTFGSLIMLLPASAMGFFSAGVLNARNIGRIDADGDACVTVAGRLGRRRALIYQTVLLALGWICMNAYCSLRFFDSWHYLFVISMPLFVLHFVSLRKNNEKGRGKSVSLLVAAVFLFSAAAGTGFLAFLF